MTVSRIENRWLCPCIYLSKIKCLESKIAVCNAQHSMEQMMQNSFFLLVAMINEAVMRPALQPPEKGEANKKI